MPEHATPPQNIRRVGFLGDVHMDARFTAAAIRGLKDQGADVIVQLGDFGYTFDDYFVDSADAALSETRLTLMFVDGNHEDHQNFLRTRPAGNDRLRPITPRILHAGRGYRWEWDGVRFLALGGAHSVDAGARQRYGWMWHPEETLTDGQITDAVTGGDTDVMITHDCPAGVDIPGLQSYLFPDHEIRRADIHRGRLREVVDKVRPWRILHGHYHIDYHGIVDFGWGPMHVTGLADNTTGLPEATRVFDLESLRPLGL